ncbi:MAG TPA: bifunctional DNA-binding transcriptional regulator/O6-methylguanine-DNA methyltransferase Ada [Bryobacteraceae bacterium]|nr:bifunctional DNA-binding transcriptional regulator/O6-methylguanine-DNA methyltransferase Ada [Bryobacteraceae bacterium]
MPKHIGAKQQQSSLPDRKERDMLNQERCWESVQNRDRMQDGKFVFGVMTTGVYCRPSCPARKPLRKNVRFYATPSDAERDGLRACLRCRPLATIGADPNTERIREVCRYIEAHSDGELRLAELAKMARLSPYHFQRSFKAIAGVTPRQYVEGARLDKLKGSLRTARDVTEAVYDAGYGSASRVYERAGTHLGMTPNQYRQGGRDLVITHVTIHSPVGLLMMAATDRGVCFVRFGASEPSLLSELKREYPSSQIEPMRKPYHPDFAKWVDALTRHLEGKQPHVDLPLDIRATVFQMRVWHYLQSIPYGEVQSYGEVASGIGQPTATRAVANACASNPVAIVIPCHRVIRGTGELGGYRWGLARKRVLIDRERAAVRT